MTFDRQASTVRVTVEGKEHDIPRAWLVGRTYTHERNGLGPGEARAAAFRDWHAYVTPHDPAICTLDVEGGECSCPPAP